MSSPSDPGEGASARADSLAARLESRFGAGIDPAVALHAADEGEEQRADLSAELVTRLSGRERSFGRYRMKGEIARGGMGAILKIWDEDLHRHLAMKLILDQGETRLESSKLARFLEEAQVTGQLDHPGIVPVHELGLDPDGRVYFTMKLVKGSSLKEVFDLVAAGQQGWTQAKALGVLLKVCEAMAYAHDKGVIHRDLKPANVMVGKFGEVYVMDWGLARIIGRKDEKNIRIREQSPALSTELRSERDAQRGETPDSPLCTMDGDVVGTPAYMPPEQAAGLVDEVGPHSDVYALGAMLYHLLAGHMPYVPKGARYNNYAVWNRVQEGPPTPVSELAGKTPMELVAICEKAMARKHGQRYADMSELAADLSAYLEHRVVGAYRTGVLAEVKKWIERNRPLVAALAAGVIVLLLGLFASMKLKVEADSKAAQVRSAVDAACDESLAFTRARKLQEALASAERALALAETNGMEAALQERLRAFVAQAELDVQAANRERGLREQDDTLRRTLLDLRLQQLEAVNDQMLESDLDAAFVRAFHDYGVDLEGADVVPALQRIRERAIAEEVALALDDWGRTRRSVHGVRSEKAENLYNLAMDLDPDPGRQRLRQAIHDGELELLFDLASPENLPKLAPGSIWVLSAMLWDNFAERRPEVLRIYDQALRIHPDDFLLQAIGADLYQALGRFDDALVCRMAAWSLRPNSPLACIGVAEALLFLGRLDDALESARACAGTFPGFAKGQYVQALIEVQLGEYGDALAHISRALELEDNPGWHPDLLALRFRNGLASKSDVVGALQTETARAGLGTYMLALLDHPDPAQRDPQLVLGTLSDSSGVFTGSNWVWEIETVARIRVEDWNGALSTLGSHFDLPTVLLLTPGAFDFVRSLVNAKVGRLEAARECYARGMSLWNTLTAGNPDAWSKSDVARWRREAEAALAK